MRAWLHPRSDQPRAPGNGVRDFGDGLIEIVGRNLGDVKAVYCQSELGRDVGQTLDLRTTAHLHRRALAGDGRDRARPPGGRVRAAGGELHERGLALANGGEDWLMRAADGAEKNGGLIVCYLAFVFFIIALMARCSTAASA